MKVINKSDFDIVIYGIDEYSIEEFIDINSDVNTVAWCDGFLFAISHLDSVKFSELLVDKNERTFAALDYAEMLNYKPVLTTKYNNNIGVMDHSHTETFQRMAKFIRDQKKYKQMMPKDKK